MRPWSRRLRTTAANWQSPLPGTQLRRRPCAQLLASWFLWFPALAFSRSLKVLAAFAASCERSSLDRRIAWPRLSSYFCGRASARAASSLRSSSAEHMASLAMALFGVVRVRVRGHARSAVLEYAARGAACPSSWASPTAARLQSAAFFGCTRVCVALDSRLIDFYRQGRPLSTASSRPSRLLEAHWGPSRGQIAGRSTPPNQKLAWGVDRGHARARGRHSSPGARE